MYYRRFLKVRNSTTRWGLPMINSLRLAFTVFALVIGLSSFVTEAEAQHRRPVAQVGHRHSRRLRHPRQAPIARPGREARPPRYLNTLRGPGHRAFTSVGADYLPMIAAAYNRMVGEIGAWRPHIARCAAYHDHFVEAARVFQVPVAFVAGIAMHESYCIANARDWAGGRGIAQLTYISRRFHVRPLERVLHRRMAYRNVMRRRRIVQAYNPTDHLLVGLMHWAYPERLTGWCVNRRGCGILGYNMDPGTFAQRAHRLARTLGHAPTFAELAADLPCITGPHGRCPREYVARVLAAGYMYEQYMQGLPQATVTTLAGDRVPGFDPAFDRSFPTTITPR